MDKLEKKVHCEVSSSDFMDLAAIAIMDYGSYHIGLTSSQCSVFIRVYRTKWRLTRNPEVLSRRHLNRTVKERSRKLEWSWAASWSVIPESSAGEKAFHIS